MIFHYQNLRNCAGYLLTWFLGCFPMFFGCALGVLEKVWTRSRVLFQYPEQIFAKWIQRAISIRSKMNMFSGVILVFGANFSKNATFGHVYGGYFGFTPRTQKFGHVYGGCFGFRSKFSPKTQSLDTFTGLFRYSEQIYLT